MAAVDFDVKLVPANAFIKDASGEVVFNPSFSGLAGAEAEKLGNFFHFRPAVALEKIPPLERVSDGSATWHAWCLKCPPPRD